MNQPLVSVVMVVCNVERFLAQSIESILGQTFRNFEFIILDYGSTDDSKAIVSRYAAKDGRIKLRETPHCGLAEARNTVSFLAQGRYIAVMDADDVSMPDRLQWESTFMEGHPEIGVVGGAIQWIDGTGKALRVDSRPTHDEEIKKVLLDHYPFCHSSLLMRRDAFVRAGGYRAAFAPAEDYDLALRMSEHCKCANLEQVVLGYRIHATQLSIQKGKLQSLCKLAARASAVWRRKGHSDPLSSVGEITSALLAGLGVTEETQQRAIALDRYQWIRDMCMAGESSLALDAAVEMLQSDLKYVERWLIADLRLRAAQLYWTQRQFGRSLLTGAQAFTSRPELLVRPLKRLLQRHS
jgi:GT2 family glycosyltransferase